MPLSLNSRMTVTSFWPFFWAFWNSIILLSPSIVTVVLHVLPSVVVSSTGTPWNKKKYKKKKMQMQMQMQMQISHFFSRFAGLEIRLVVDWNFSKDLVDLIDYWFGWSGWLHFGYWRKLGKFWEKLTWLPLWELSWLAYAN